jgi:quercetin dioxygenase-like cupin family protein
MSTAITDYVRRTVTMEWHPLTEAGVDTRGIFVKSLRSESESGRPISFLLKFEPGASYPYHRHPKGEEILVIEGSCRVEGEDLVQGDYLYTPPGFSHGVTSEKGCVLFLMVPAEVEIMSRPD